MTEEELSVMEDPYINRYDRKVLNEDGTMGKAYSRSALKK